MRDVDERDAVFVAHAQHDLEDHRSERRIHHGHRFVGHDQTWPQQECSRDHDPLALSAAELMRVLLQYFRAPQPDHTQGRLDHLVGRVAVAGEVEALDDHVEHMFDPIEGVVDLVRILKNRLHFATVGDVLLTTQL